MLEGFLVGVSDNRLREFSPSETASADFFLLSLLFLIY